MGQCETDSSLFKFYERAATAWSEKKRGRPRNKKQQNWQNRSEGMKEKERKKHSDQEKQNKMQIINQKQSLVLVSMHGA